jgi:hypothetical protein
MALIVGAGVRGRDYRRNIFNPNYNAATAAYGPHARYASVCSIDFASGYAEARSYVLEPMPRIRFNDATPIIDRGAAEAALFRESVERMDRP